MRKLLFVGNRLEVLKSLESYPLEVSALIYKDSYAHKHIDEISFAKIEIFKAKDELLDLISSYDFDILLSNGCPYILPISRLKKQNQLFINIHPSLLPSLRGKHPINGAILFNQSAGVSVHMMSDDIDRGDILAQLEIPIKNLTLPLLYKLCFKAEARAFKMAFDNGFKRVESRGYKESYYSRPKENAISINVSNTKLLRFINAFSIEALATRVITDKGGFRVLKAARIKNAYLDSLECRNYEVVEAYENKILLYKDRQFLELELLDFPSFKIGEILHRGGVVSDITKYIFKIFKTFKFSFAKGGIYAIS